MDRYSRISLFAIFIPVLAFYKALFPILVGLILMDCASSLKLVADGGFGCGFFVFGFGPKLGNFLVMFFVFSLGFKVLRRGGLRRCFRECGCGRPRDPKDGFCSKALSYDVAEGGWKDIDCNGCGASRKLRTPSKVNGDHSLNDKDGGNGLRLDDDVGKEQIKIDEGEDERVGEVCNEDDVFDVIALRKMVKVQRQRANTVYKELEKERTAAASAADEAISMIMRLQNEKSSLQIQINQFQRLAEEKQLHDQEVIQSMRWLLMSHEADRSLLQEQLKLCIARLKSYALEDDVVLDCSLYDQTTPCTPPSFSAGSTLEDALISSLDWDLSPI